MAWIGMLLPKLYNVNFQKLLNFLPLMQASSSRYIVNKDVFYMFELCCQCNQICLTIDDYHPNLTKKPVLIPQKVAVPDLDQSNN